MTYIKGEVWWVKFPLEESSTEYIVRPAIIADVCLPNVAMIKVTKHIPRTGDAFDIELHNYIYAGLSEPSTARVSKIMVFNEAQILNKSGRLDRGDYKRVFDALDTLLS